MSEYTSSREGFQKAMKWSFNGTPEETQQYIDATTTPDFYQIVNGDKLAGDDYVQDIAGWRGKITEFDPTVEDFLRDGDQLAARLTGDCKLQGNPTGYEIFIHAHVDQGSGKMRSMVQRAVYGAPGQKH